jgi:hypothetical protein
MVLPESKRFPIDVGMIEPPASKTAHTEERDEAGGGGSRLVVDEDSIARVAASRSWDVVVGDGKWVVTIDRAGATRRVQVEEGGGPGGGILRFTAFTQSAASTPDDQRNLLRRNARIAYAAFGIGIPSDPSKVVTTATLLKDTADDDEIAGALESTAFGGEPIEPRPLGEFDRSRYKLLPSTPEPGVWEAGILKRALEGTGVPFESRRERADTLFRLGGDRTQKVFVLFDRADSAGNQMLHMISVCGPAREEHYRMALGTNPRLAFAAIGLAEVGGEENLVVVRTQLAATADPEEVLVALSTLAQIGDRIEHQITGGEDLR